jgi:broad specificity phosphatase PhoE
MPDSYKPGVYLLRHPTTALNSTDPTEDRIRGWKDVPLDKHGKEQAVQLARYAEVLAPAEVYCSDLSRSRDLGRMIARACRVKLEVRKAYRPWGLGGFQGQSSARVHDELKKYARDCTKKVPGGESFQEFMTRWIDQLRDCLADHVLDGRTIVGVAHFRNMKAAEAWIRAGMQDDPCKIDLAVFEKNDLPNGGLMRIWLEGGRFHFAVLSTPLSASNEDLPVKKAPATLAARRIGIRTVRQGLPKAS